MWQRAGLIACLLLLGCSTTKPKYRFTESTLDSFANDAVPLGMPIDSAVKRLESQGFRCKSVDDSVICAAEDQNGLVRTIYQINLARGSDDQVVDVGWSINGVGP